MGNEYPRGRGGLFAFDVIKLMHKTQAAKQMGASAVLVVTHVAIGEHREDYLMPPSFWSAELMAAAGITDDEAFSAARRRAVGHGWLVYEKGAIRQAGKYWVAVPTALEEAMSYHRKKRSMTGSSPEHDRSRAGASPDHDRIITGSSPDHDRGLSLPLPSPVPIQGEGDAPAPAHDHKIDKKSENTEILKKQLRKCGLSVKPDAVEEWADLLQGSIKVKSVEQAAWAVRWLVTTGLAEGIAVRFAKDAGPALAQRCRKQLKEYLAQGGIL